MFPTYHGYKPDFKLDQDDIDAIQALYGPPKVSSFPYDNDCKRLSGCGHSGHVIQQATKDVYQQATKGQRSLAMCMEAPSSTTEQDTPQIQSTKQAAATIDQLEKSELSQPMISEAPASAQNNSTSPPTSKIYPQLMQDSLNAVSGSSKINPMVTPGHHGPMNNQHQAHWTYGVHHSAQMRARAKNKFYKWSILATLVTTIAVALFFFLYYRK